MPVNARLCDFFAKSYSPIHASTYVENVAGQVRPLVRERLSARLSFSGAHMTFFALVRSLKGQRASQATGFAALAIAAAALISWWAGLETLSSGGSGFATMKPMTALCLTALGLALVHPGKNSRFGLAVGLAVAAIAVLDLLNRFGIDSGINRLNSLLMLRAAVPGSETSFPMINGVPVALALAGASLALSRFEKYHLAATALSGLAGFMQVFNLLAYLSGVHTFYGSVETPRPLTAVGLLCVIIAIVLRIGALPALRKPRPLWHLQVMLGCAIIAPLLLFGVYTGIRITDAQLREVRNDLTSEARILSAGVDREITGEIERLQALAASPSLRQGDFAEFQRQAAASLAFQQRGNIVLIDRNMQLLVNTFVPFGKRLPKAVVPKPIERAFATGKPQVTGVFMAPFVDQFMFGIIVPVEIGSESRYIVGRSQNQHALARLVAANELPPGRLAVVADAAHRIIARSGQEDTFVGTELPAAQWHRAERGGVFEFTDSEGRPSLQAYARSELTGCETAVWAPRVLLEAPVRALWWTIALTALLAFMLVVALASWLGRIIARSVGHAARVAIALGEGGPMPLSGTPVSEVNALMTELRRSAARRQAAEDLLRDSERHLYASKSRLQFALDAALLGWWQYDPRRRVVSGDARSKEIFDVTSDETPIAEIMKQVHPDDAKGLWAASEAALDPIDAKPYAIEFRVHRRAGEVRWVEVHWRAYFEGARRDRGAASIIGTVADVTERKEREEREHLLMREVNHRAKNMLSVVDAIAHQTASRNPEDFVERFSERIQALSANQDLLVRNEWNGVEVEDLVRAQLALFADLIGSRICVDGPKLRFKA